MRVFFHVQHLLGIGHLRRATTLARALASEGFDVLLVSGGAPVPGLRLDRARFHQLPPLRAKDENLRDLCHLDGRPLDESFCAARTAELLALLRSERPDIVVTEQFPFGRTRLRFELLPLLQAARALDPPPLVVSSVRDVLRRVSPQRVAETVAIFGASFDAVLIHADRRLADFATSFAGWEAIRSQAHFTGYVAETDLSRQPASQAGSGEVIVSVGGGAVGAPLLECAIAARPRTTLARRVWRLLRGPNLPAVPCAASVPQGVVIEPARADFTTLLANATLSISQAGYNTVVETLCCADRAVLVPFGNARETEQADRAQILAGRGLAAMVPPGALSADALAEAVERALAGPSIRSFPRCDVDGTRHTAVLLRRLLEARGRG